MSSFSIRTLRLSIANHHLPGNKSGGQRFLTRAVTLFRHIRRKAFHSIIEPVEMLVSEGGLARLVSPDTFFPSLPSCCIIHIRHSLLPSSGLRLLVCASYGANFYATLFGDSQEPFFGVLQIRPTENMATPIMERTASGIVGTSSAGNALRGSLSLD